MVKVKRMREWVSVILLALGVCSSAGAQEPLPKPKAVAAPDAANVPPKTESAPIANGAAVAGAPERRRRLQEAANRQGYCCSDDPAIPGCGSFREEMRFIFGSCRTLFGEPCLPNPPRPRLWDRLRYGAAGCEPR